MSDQAFKYLAAIILKSFSNNNPIPGQRFHVRVEKDDQVQKMYKALAIKAESFQYEDYNTFAIQYPGVQLILAASGAVSPTEGFLTHLRNQTASQNGVFKGTALLIIHNTSLDSIIGGAEGLTKEGNPLHIKSFRKALLNSIDSLSADPSEKQGLRQVLEEYNSTIHEDSSTIFSYSPFMALIQKNAIQESDWIELGMFPDSELKQSNDKKAIKERVSDNRRLFEDVQRAHRFHPETIDEELSRIFIKTGVNKLKDNNWESSYYGQVKKWNDEKKDMTPNSYLEPNELFTDGLSFWERGEGETAAANRKRHIIIFNPECKDNVQHTLEFKRTLRASGLQPNKEPTLSTSITKNTIIVDFTGCRNEPKIERIRYDDDQTSARFFFHIAVFPFSSNILEAFKSSYLLDGRPKNKKLCLRSDGPFIFNKNGANESDIDLSMNSVINLDNDTKFIARIAEDEPNDDNLSFELRWFQHIIPCEVIQDPVKQVSVSGLNIWKWKREKCRSFEYEGENKLVFGNNEYFTNRERILTFLEYEKQIITPTPQDFYWGMKKNILSPKHVEIDPDLKKAFLNLLTFYHKRNLLPSLTPLQESNDLIELCKKYVEVFTEKIESIESKIGLDKYSRNLMRLGTIESDPADGEQQILFTPLHPLNVSYQLAINDSLGKEEVPKEILNCLGHNSLIPFINGSDHDKKDKLAAVRETELMEWTVYRPIKTHHRGWHNEFVHKLIADKISEYVNHFDYLFTGSPDAPIRINLMNMGDCIDALKGIIRYYQNSLKKVNGDSEKIHSIALYIYGEQNGFNIFEEFALYGDSEKIGADFEINLPVVLKNSTINEDDVLSIIREKLDFYIKGSSAFPDYSHITFFKFDSEDVNWTYHNTKSINTGCSLSGLINAVPSFFLDDQYITGFGMKHSDDSKSPLLKIAASLNALARVDRTPDPFEISEATFSTFRDEQKTKLNHIYDNSNWITFIDPKVDLNFFKTNEKSKDLIIIHYSDQYNNTSGYDAITVTRKSKQYRSILKEFLDEHKVNYEKDHDLTLINMFNAINGDWLLRLISGRAHFPREKISILSAVKIMLAILEYPDFVWVPLSLEEVLRVTGSAGLKQKEGLFAVKNLNPGNLNAYSDDLLLAGVEFVEGQQPNIHFLPVEVKIGFDQTKKGKLQGTNTANILKEYLTGDSFKTKFYRNFFAKLIILAAEKMELYGVFPEQEWGKISNDSRQDLLNDNFKLNWSLNDCFGKSVVLSFKKNSFKQIIRRSDEHLIIDMLESDAYTTLIKGTKELIERYKGPGSDIDQKFLLCNCYSNKVIDTPIDNDDIKNSDKTTIKQTKDSDPETIVTLGKHMLNENPVDWRPLALTNPHCMILGGSGKGKTQTVKSIILQLAKQKIPSIIIDFNDDFIDSTFLKHTEFDLIDTMQGIPINPFEIAIDPETKEKTSFFTVTYKLPETLNEIFKFGTKEFRILRDTIKDLFESHGFSSSPGSWQNTAPAFINLKYALENLADDQPKEADRIHNILGKLSPLFDLNLFSGSDGSAIFDDYFSKGAVFRLKSLLHFGASIQTAMMQFVLEKIYNRMATLGHTKSLRFLCVIDEAHYLKMNEKIDRLVKEARKFGIGLILSTQEAKDLSPSVWANTATIMSLGLKKKDADTVVSYLGIPKSETEDLSIQLQNFQPGDCLIKNDQHNPYDAIKIEPYDKIIQKLEF